MTLALAAILAVMAPATSPASRPASQPSSGPTSRRVLSAEELSARREAFARRQQQELAKDAGDLVETIREALKADPKAAVDQLNRQWMQQLIDGGKFAEAEEFATAGSVGVARDTWAIEQLQRHRVRALLAAEKPAEALAAAKGLFFVAGMGSVGHDLNLIAECLRAAHPDDGGAVARFKLQQLAGAQPDAARRRAASAGSGESVLASVEIDPKPYLKAIEERRDLTDFNGLYGTGNLLLLSGRAKEARACFEHAYAVAPPGELRYATEALAKLIKAEDCSIGRANEFVASVRPR
jgi:TolA-binding protein